MGLVGHSLLLLALLGLLFLMPGIGLPAPLAAAGRPGGWAVLLLTAAAAAGGWATRRLAHARFMCWTGRPVGRRTRGLRRRAARGTPGDGLAPHEHEVRPHQGVVEGQFRVRPGQQDRPLQRLPRPVCRASGGPWLHYPTRVAYGINTFPKNSPSHCKLEVYLPPYGWVPLRRVGDAVAHSRTSGTCARTSAHERRRIPGAGSAQGRLRRRLPRQHLVLADARHEITTWSRRPARARGGGTDASTPRRTGSRLPEPDPANPTTARVRLDDGPPLRRGPGRLRPFRDWRMEPDRNNH